jgi:hypothetical protein
MILNTLTRKLNRTLNCRPYSDTLNRPTFAKWRVVDVAAPMQHQSTHRFCGFDERLSGAVKGIRVRVG